METKSSTEELREKRIELQRHFDRLKRDFGINLSVNLLDARQVKTYLDFIEAIYAMMEARRELEESLWDVRLTAGNIARYSGMSKSTIDHSDDFKSILEAFAPEENNEPVITQKEHERAMNSLKDELDELRRKEKEHEKRELDYVHDNKDIQELKEDLKTEREALDSLQEKVQRVFESKPSIADEFKAIDPGLIRSFWPNSGTKS